MSGFGEEPALGLAIAGFQGPDIGLQCRAADAFVLPPYQINFATIAISRF